MVSNILRSVSEDVSAVYPLIAGCIGVNTAGAFRTWCEIYSRLPDMELVFRARCFEVPTRPELMYATGAAMADYARKGATEIELQNSVEYALKLPVEFRFRLFSDYYRMRPVREKLRRDKTFSQWLIYHKEAGEI